MAAPTSSNVTITINEDTPRILTTAEFAFADADVGDVLSKVKITTLPVNGILNLNGSPVALNQDISEASITAGLLEYVPGANGNGTAYATIGFQVSDGVNYSSSYTITINVLAVNDAPVAGNYSIVVSKNTTYTGNLPNATDAEGSTVIYAKATDPMVGATAIVSANGSFTYTPKTDTVGNDSFTYTVSDGVAFNTYTVSISIIATVVIPVSAVTEGTATIDGSGAFDVFMQAIVAHLTVEYEKRRITSDAYPQIYLGAMQTALSQAVTFALQKPLIEKQATSEEAKTGLIIRQTKGFDDDAKQKLLKQALDSWSVAYSVAQDANSIPDSIKVNPIDSIMKSAMDALNISNTNNPLGEI